MDIIRIVTTLTMCLSHLSGALPLSQNNSTNNVVRVSTEPIQRLPTHHPQVLFVTIQFSVKVPYTSKNPVYSRLENHHENKELLQTAPATYYYYSPYFELNDLGLYRRGHRRISAERPLSNYEEDYDKFPTVA